MARLGARPGPKFTSSLPSADALPIQAQAGQFAFYFRYAGPDGKFGGLHPDKIDEGNSNFFGLDPENDIPARDDIQSGELVVPVNKEIHLMMHAKDVGHSFYVRELRIQQDFVPGLDLSLHFTATKVGQVRNCMYPALRPRPLQHEGVYQRDVAGRFRQLVESRSPNT